MKSSTWILLRGLARERRHWGSFTEDFQAAFPNDEVLALDLPGAGQLNHQRSPITVKEIFLSVRAQAIELARSQAQFKVVALSLGGMVAMEWMNHKPEDLAGCVLINCSSRELSPTYNRLRWQIWPEFLKLVASQAVKERERMLVDLLINSPEAREKALPLWIKLANECGVSYLNTFNQLLAASRFKGLAHETKVPVLLMSGLGDRFVDPSCTTKMHEKWRWPLQQHAWAGHDLPWDDPAWVIAKIRAWSETVDTSR